MNCVDTLDHSVCLLDSMDRGRSSVTSSRNQNASRFLTIGVHHVAFLTVTRGRLNRWISPALRGLVAKPLRDHFCNEMGGKVRRLVVQGGRDKPLFEMQNDTTCAGCLKNASCGYGRVLEPDRNVIDNGHSPGGMGEGLRALTFRMEMANLPFRDLVAHPYLLENISAENHPGNDGPGTTTDPTFWVEKGIPLITRFVAIGNTANAVVPKARELLVNRLSTCGFLGKPTVFASLLPNHEWSETRLLNVAELPITPLAGSLSRLTLRLQAPLTLKAQNGQEKQASGAASTVSSNANRRSRLQSLRSKRWADAESPPSFSLIVENAVRTVCRAVVELGDRSLLTHSARRQFFRDALLRPSERSGDWDTFMRDAASVATCLQALVPFRQKRSSSRKPKAHDQIGFTGDICFADVPLQYLPWLEWAGLLGIGDSRGSGAGIWELVFGSPCMRA